MLLIQNTQFLAVPRTMVEISNIMEVVNSYIETPNNDTEDDVKKLIERIETKF